ncbi:MAG TPA: hypothetical protein DEP05_09550 [Betaproteobacteria bacterium]|nr:hypothetical protein [Betaproteobacteria bacterium]
MVHQSAMRTMNKPMRHGFFFPLPNRLPNTQIDSTMAYCLLSVTVAAYRLPFKNKKTSMEFTQ